MKRIQSDTVSGCVAKIAASTLVFFLSLASPAFSQARAVTALPAVAAFSASPQAPDGVKVVARVALDSQPVTRLYTQWEDGRTYSYIEHGRRQLTTVDITRKQNPQIVYHAPTKVEATRYQELAEGGTIEVSPQWHVSPGVDNVGGRGMFSILESGNSDDASLLQAFGRESTNLADRDHHLIFFASPAQLLIVEDGRWKGIDYTSN